jgi:serine/threonine-protein kinase
LAYRTAKFVRRNRLAVAAAVVVLATILAASVVSVRQAIEATRQRDRALSLVARNEAVVNFFSSMLSDVAPADQPVRVADLLDRSREILLTEESIPEHRAAILHMLAAYYLSSGKPAQADDLLNRSLELTRSTSDAGLRATLLCESAFAASLLGRPVDAASLIEQGLTSSVDDSLTTVQCLRNRAFIAQNTNDPQAALDYALQAQARLRESPIPKPDVEAEVLADIAAAHYLAGRNGAAERYYSEALEKFVAMGRGDSPRIFFLRNNWGTASLASGDVRRALEQYDEALRIAVQRSVGGEPPPYLLVNRASALLSLARYEDALAAYEVAIGSASRAGNATVRVAALTGRAHTHFLMGDVDRAERELQVIKPEVGSSIPPDSSPAMAILQLQARIDAERGQLTEAIAGLSRIVEFFDGRGMRVAAVVRALNLRSDVRLRQGDPDAAIADAQRALEIARSLQGDKPYSSLSGQALLAQARAHERRGERATTREVAAKALPQLRETLGAAHPDTVLAERYVLAANPS